MTFELKFEPRDLWIGVFWDHRWHYTDLFEPGSGRHVQRRDLHVYVCPLPCVVLHLQFPGKEP